MSPKDLNTLDLIPKLIDAGVNSLKIEGRMKRPEYVAIVVETYRNMIDGNFQSDSHKRLAQIFNRDFTTAYLEKNQGRRMISDMKPNNRGLLIGRVTAIEKDSIKIKITDKINRGDQIEIWIKVGGRVTITVENYKIDGDICTININEKIRGVKIHDRVFKIFDSELTEHARKFFKFDKPIRRIDIDAEFVAKLNQTPKLKMTDIDGNIAEVESKICTVEAKNQPLNREIILKQISRLGNTVFNLKKISIDIDENIMLPISELNEIRRRAVQILEEKRLNNKKFSSTKKFTLKNFQKLTEMKSSLNVHVDTLELLQTTVGTDIDEILFGGESYRHEKILPSMYQEAIKIAHGANKKIFIATPRIIRENEQYEFEEILKSVNDADGIYIHNVAALNLIKKFSKIPIRTDFSLIAFNSETLNFFKNFDVESVTLSPEMTFEQIKLIAKKTPIQLESIVHGRIELMISQYCAVGSFIGGVGEHVCSQPCKHKKFYLRDRMSAIFPIVTDQFCRMHILNSKSLSMIPYAKDFKQLGIKIRIDGRFFDKDELETTIKKYRSSMNGETVEENFEFTRGHYFRGV